MLSENDIRHELALDYDRLYGADGTRIRERDQELMRDLMRSRWKRGEFTEDERKSFEQRR